jgi:hypothetical protein
MSSAASISNTRPFYNRYEPWSGSRVNTEGFSGSILTQLDYTFSGAFGTAGVTGPTGSAGFNSSSFTSLTGSGAVSLSSPISLLYLTQNPNSVSIPTPTYAYQTITLVVEGLSSPASGTSLALTYTDTYGYNQTISGGIVGDVYSFLGSSDRIGWTESVNTRNSAPIVKSLQIGTPIPGEVTFQGNLINVGVGTLSSVGCYWGTSLSGIFANFQASTATGPGVYSLTFSVGSGGETVYVMAAAQCTLPYYTGLTSYGTAYGVGNILSIFVSLLCLAKGTLITLANGRVKPIEKILYKDRLKVWSFDEGKHDTAFPLWIKVPERATKYNRLEFSDGSVLKTIGQHRLFNYDRGCFTYPMTDDTPIGTNTINISGEIVQLVSKTIVEEPVEYYNIISDYHMNLYAEGILTSCRYNNLFPITGMKFIKGNKPLLDRAIFENMGIEDKYIRGLRLQENSNIDPEETLKYVQRLERLKMIE